VAEEGTHDELVDKQGVYWNLVKSQLSGIKSPKKRHENANTLPTMSSSASDSDGDHSPANKISHNQAISNSN
jgi:hypothetical protein